MTQGKPQKHRTAVITITYTDEIDEGTLQDLAQIQAGYDGVQRVFSRFSNGPQAFAVDGTTGETSDLRKPPQA